jgi:hypothetical protein
MKRIRMKVKTQVKAGSLSGQEAERSHLFLPPVRHVRDGVASRSSATRDHPRQAVRPTAATYGHRREDP